MVRSVFGWCVTVPKRGAKVSPKPGVTKGDEGVYTISMGSTSTEPWNMGSTSTVVMSSSTSLPVSAASTVDIATAAAPPPKPAAEMQARRSFLWHLLIDLPVLLLVGAICILLEVGAIPSRRNGFICNDPALSYPYTGDTFSISLVAIVTVLVPFIVLWAVEATLYRSDEYVKTNRLAASVKTSALIYKDYIYVSVVNLTVMEVVKCVVGSPRPTFFELCQPDTKCNGSQYVSSYKCTSDYSRYLQIDSSRSFPSAHASLSIYCGLFLAWYLQRRAFSWRNSSVLLVPLVQTLCILYAAVCSLTRITDHRHHWWDVLVGAGVGIVSAMYAVLVLCKNFNEPTVASSSDLSSSDSNNHPSVRRLLAGERIPVP